MSRDCRQGEIDFLILKFSFIQLQMEARLKFLIVHLRDIIKIRLKISLRNKEQNFIANNQLRYFNS